LAPEIRLPSTTVMPTMTGMAKDEVLTRVERDLAQGYTHPALQRLASLTTAYPDDLGLRAKRAEVHRRVGNFAEAGRWGFLTDDVTAQDLAAFERTWPTATLRLQVLKLPSGLDAMIGQRAEQRLSSLRDAAGKEERAAVAKQPSSSGGVGCLVATVLFVLAVLALITIGAITVITAVLPG